MEADDGKSLKRPDRPTGEKVSPEKKMVRTDAPPKEASDQTASVARALNFEGTESSADSAGGPQQVQQPPQPTPSVPSPQAPPDAVKPAAVADPNAVLTLALQKIAELEAQLKAQAVPSSASPAPCSTFSQESLKTPPSKAPLAPTPSTDSTKPAENEDGDEQNNDEDDDTTGDMLVMPSGNAVTWLLNISCECLIRQRLALAYGFKWYC